MPVERGTVEYLTVVLEDLESTMKALSEEVDWIKQEIARLKKWLEVTR
jgi:hypothetical protein